MNAIELPRLPLVEQSRGTIFRDAESLIVSPRSVPPECDFELADQLFATAISQSPSFRQHSKVKKLKHWRVLVYRAVEAIRISGCLRYARNKNAPGVRAFLNVIDCAIECGFFRSEPGKSGGKHRSRLVPSLAFRQELAALRPTFQIDSSFVCVRCPVIKIDEGGKARKVKGVRKAADMRHPIAAERQAQLAVISDVLGKVEVTYRVYERFERRTRERLVCVPRHVSMFHSDSFDKGGRMIGSSTDGHFSHQSLRAAERETIWFDGQPSVELDYSCFLPRLLYHREGVDYPGDVYTPGGSASEAERLLNKLVLNIALNAKDNAAILRACNTQKSDWGKPRQLSNGKTLPPVHKTGKSLDEARGIQDALRESGLHFRQVRDNVIAAHAPISHHFGTGATMKFQPTESKIALNVIYGFVRRGIPCLGVHDSFIVPLDCEAELREVMSQCYYDEVGFFPVIKGGNEIVRQRRVA